MIISPKAKYPNQYGDGTSTFTQKEAIEQLKEVVQVCRDKGTKEKSFHLYLNTSETPNCWSIVAHSVIDQYGNGFHIKEIEL